MTVSAMYKSIIKITHNVVWIKNNLISIKIQELPVSFIEL